MNAPAAGTNPLVRLLDFGQSPWLDYIRRDLILSGELARLIREDGLRGVTSNPAIFEKAISGSRDYNDILSRHPAGVDAKSIFEEIAIRDVRDAADVLRPVYESSQAHDGYVSLEVSPALAHDTAGTIAEARRLWAAVGRPNLMIKVPGTPEGIPVIEQLIADGININVTLLFAQQAYEQAALAFQRGLAQRAAQGLPVSGIASVASFFVSRIDSKIDALLAQAAPEKQPAARALAGKVAIANARLAYQRYLRLFSGAEWQALAAQGAQVQRLLWASTGSKNPAYRDVIYVEQLIGADTVNTLPPATFDAFRDHGVAAETLSADLDDAARTLDALAEVGIDFGAVTDALLHEGVALFEEAFVRLLAAIDQREKPVGAISPLRASLPAPLGAAVARALEEWQAGDRTRRLWAKDAALWTNGDEARWLDWLTIPGAMLAQADALSALAADIRDAGFTHILLLGMGGSSLAPEVLRMTYGALPGWPELHVLDSTDPQQVRAAEAAVDLTRTLFIVASKSGSTLEPNIFKQYFFARVSQALGTAEAGRRFIAITDPGSKMEQVAQADGFRHIAHGLPGIGGRYSALSVFGMLPAALMGLDVRRFLERAQAMAALCGPETAAAHNPGVVLGAIVGAAHNLGRDKLTLILSPAVSDLGAWLEQLLAESTGKLGKGVIPVDREPLAAPAVYGSDRVFVYIRHAAAPDAAQEALVDALEAAGQPVVRIALDALYDLGAEFFRWEIATAVAGALIGIHPFDQPDVEAAKVVTRRLTTAYEQSGALPALAALHRDPSGIVLYADAANAARLGSGGSLSLAGALGALLRQITPGDYFAIAAFIEMNAHNEAALQHIRGDVLTARHCATCLGFGPRFLHSTGQAYKGGPNSGVFLQVTCEDALQLPVPGQQYTFGVVKEAQARGDFEVLAERGRRALRVHLPADVPAGLAALQAAFAQALREQA